MFVSLESQHDDDDAPNIPGRYVDESDPDIVYQNLRSRRAEKREDIITLGVHELSLNENCSVFDNNDCEKVFVSVDFLDYPPEELETPYSLDKGEPNTKYSFNFQKGLIDLLLLLLLFYLLAITNEFLFLDFSVRDPQKKTQLAQLVEPNSTGEYVYRTRDFILF